jgi:Ca2+-transporting ATPase
MILILLGAALVSGFIGDVKDTIVILIIVFLNAVVGFVQEYRAEKAVEALKKMATAYARVQRDGYVVQLPAAQIVPGDIILLEAGDMTPADIRLTETHTLKIEEASLTGESYGIEKSTEELKDEQASLGDRFNMAYKGTLVTYGRGIGVVVATGMDTAIGNIAQMLQEKESQTPLQKRLNEFGKKLSIGVLAICGVIFMVGYLRGEEPLYMLLTAISVAVAAIPEALPAVITIALALGAKKMVRKNALIRKLPAVETLGSVTYICTDKTGTLTQNKMSVRDIWVSGNEATEKTPLSQLELLLFGMAANQDTKTSEDGTRSGDPTEKALVEYALQHSSFRREWIQDFKRVYEIPFDSERKLMTTLHQLSNEQHIVITKGALESVLEICGSIQHREAITQKAALLAGGGQRVIAYSYKVISDTAETARDVIEKNQYFIGLAGMIDPPRAEAKQAVEECITAGIIPVMITGDHPLTARVIAEELGILRFRRDKLITGAELTRLSQDEFEHDAGEIKVYARVSPEQKLQIVKTLQKKNQFVAMTGDGVNDAPALKRANIGIAMGITGTDVAKEAAHMILLDDNFATIVKAVKEGRRIFDNIRRFIKYVLTCNAAEIWTIFLAPLLALPIPVLPIHILWINLVTDGLPGLTLAGEKAEKNIMQRPPRQPDESIFAHGLGFHVLWVGLLMAGITLGVQAWALKTENNHWQTMVFTTLCFCQMAHVLAIRSERFFLFQQGIFSNWPLIGAVLLTFLLQLLLIYYPPLHDIFQTQPLTLREVLICILAASIIFHAVELEKYVRFLIEESKRKKQGFTQNQ